MRSSSMMTPLKSKKIAWIITLLLASERRNVYSPAGAFWPCSVGDRKSTRLNSSHSQISYAVFCLKKKKTQITQLNELHVPSRLDHLSGDHTADTQVLPHRIPAGYL